jgi:hypothetical protein
MNFLSKVFDWMLVIGLILMFGRIATAIFLWLDIPFITFFKDYNVISIIILIIGAIGQKMMKDHQRKQA